MEQKNFIRAYCTLLFLLLLNASFAQEDKPGADDSLRKHALKVYFDCYSCSGDDRDFIRQELTFVNYVRDRKEAQVHIMITEQGTGSGGDEITVTYLGQKDFEGVNDTLIFTTGPDDTEQEIRDASIQVIKMGLMRYVARTPLVKDIAIDYERSEDATEVEDKWNNWVFDLSISGWFNGEESIRSLDTWSSFDVTRITPEWKLEFGIDANYSEEEFDIDGDKVLSISRAQYFNVLAVKSISEHFSVGGLAGASSSLYNNMRFAYRIKPAIEYNIFPYSESTRSQLRLLYRTGYVYHSYIDTTIDNLTSQNLFEQSFTVALGLKKKWGSINTSVTWSNYFHDFSKNSLNIWGRVNLRLFKGFSFRISGNYNFIRNQLSLPKESATEEEILLQQKVLATNFSYWGNVGITYTFGSIYNNVVNPRFGD